MRFLEVVKQAATLLQKSQRITYRALKREFNLDDDALEDLMSELIDAQRVARDEEGKVLVWVGNAGEDKGKRITDKGRKEAGEHGRTGETATSHQPPSSYTPTHLAERIRAVVFTEGERKTITALFADLKGSTALIEGLDPEEARAIIDPALQLMMDAVHRYEGYVAQALGDGIFALFGAPIAHEDHPQRALYAALRMQEEMRRYGDQVRLKHGVPLAMRVGINTGEVVVRSIRKEDLHTDYVPVGHSTNLAARMEQMATPGSILITAYTHKLTEGYFAFKALGQTQIKGVEEPLHVYEVLGAGPLRTRLQVTATRRGLTRFVGRQSEMEQLHKALDQAKAGHGQIVGVMGEPGLGKSRLFYEFKLTSQAGGLLFEAYSVSHGKATAYLPVIELLKSYFRIEVPDDERTRREKVLGKVLGLDRSLEDTLPYLFALLGLEGQPSPLQQMDPQIRRKRTFDALKKLFLRESLNQPVILIFEDLHWIDSETQGFLDTLSEGIASARILLLVNYRPEYRHAWSQKTYYTQLRLAPFGKAEAEEFLDALLTPSPLPQWEKARKRVTDNNFHALKHLILDKTEGTPFFMEEIVQELVEQGVLKHEASVEWVVTHPTPALHLPTTVQGVLAARIDRLTPDEKALLQQLAVIGREFPLSLIHQVVTQPEDELYRLLAALQHKEFLYEQPAFPEVEYIFKHALTQEVAYNSVLIERRKALHEQTAQAIEHLHHDRLEEHYSDLAHHYNRSSNTEKAITYLQRAGEQAVQRSANVEAITYLTTALELLKTLPDTRERAHHELTLYISLLGVPLQIIRSSSSLEVQAVCARARDLCHQFGETRQLFRVLFALRSFHHSRGDLPATRELGKRLLDLAQKEQDPALFVEAYRAMGSTLFHLGEFTSARAHLEQAIALYDAQRHYSGVFLYNREPGVFGLSYVAWLLWHLGYPDQARHRSAQALTLAQQLSHPLSLAAALGFAAMFHQLLRERPLTQERAEAGISLASEQGLPLWLGQGTVLRGWALTEQGQNDEGTSQIHQGLASCRTVGFELFHSYFLALMAEAYRNAGQVEYGLAAIADALAVIDKTGERFYEAEVYRLRGEFLLMQEIKSQNAKVKMQKSKIETNPQSSALNFHSEAGACVLKAIEIAQKQHAKSLELRAVMSLVRLRQYQVQDHAPGTTHHGSSSTQHETRARLDDAHHMLSDVYNWFTEGFDTKDLQEAKVLLQDLGEKVKWGNGAVENG